MQLQRSITIIFFLLLIGVPTASWWYARQNRPRPAPPQPRKEITITVIPGWNLNDVAQYLVKQGVAQSADEVLRITGAPAVYQKPLLVVSNTAMLASKPPLVSLEGYLAPETYRVFADATLPEIITKLYDQREKESESISPGNSKATLHEMLTMASIVEEEARTPEDRKIVADILWRRYEKNWALQVDSTVHYAVHKTGNVFTTAKDRSTTSLWNTYKYPGLPPGPICNPSVTSIQAAVQPKANEYWYFLSGSDGKMYYAKTFEEHTRNKVKYL